jgi:hypothetical protein
LREVALGAARATILWQTLQAVGNWNIGRELAHNSNAYGFFGVVIVLLSCIFLGSQLFLLAAEINVARCSHLGPRSTVLPPLTDADKEVFERLAQMAIRSPEAELSVAFTSEADRDPRRTEPESHQVKAGDDPRRASA